MLHVKLLPKGWVPMASSSTCSTLGQCPCWGFYNDSSGAEGDLLLTSHRLSKDRHTCCWTQSINHLVDHKGVIFPFILSSSFCSPFRLKVTVFPWHITSSTLLVGFLAQCKEPMCQYLQYPQRGCANLLS